LAATAGGMAKTRGVVATEAPTDTGVVGIACLRSSTQVLDSGTQVAGIDPDAIAANVSAAVWAVTAYVAQAPPRTARSAAAVTTAFSPGATETGTATGLAQLGVAGPLAALAAAPPALVDALVRAALPEPDCSASRCDQA